MKFVDLRLIEPILRAVSTEGYDVATPIQAQAIPHVLEGKDVLGCAQTGTGKTAAFALPILQRLSQHADHSHASPRVAGELARRDSAAHGEHGEPVRRPHAEKSSVGPRKVRCLVLCPTRELATQISDSFRTYGKNLNLRNTVIFGGVNQHSQVQAMKNGIDIVVATPGRLLDLMNQRFVDIRSIEVLVLDEADRMLDMGFIHDIRRIVSQVPAKRQTLLFSATMPSEIRQLANSLLRTPVTVSVTPPATTLELVEQSVYFVERANKPDLLAHLYDALPMSRAIVFTRTKHGADRVVRQLHTRGIRAEAIHGNKSQNARNRALENFRAAKTPILVATDIASRGIDIDGITHVVNYDLTHEPETYVHRIGRTARAGASGAAVSFCDREERQNLKAIEKLIRQTIPVKNDHPEYAKTAPKAHSPEHSRERRDSSEHPTRHGSRGAEAYRSHAAQSGNHHRPSLPSHRPHAAHPQRHDQRQPAHAKSAPAHASASHRPQHSQGKFPLHAAAKPSGGRPARKHHLGRGVKRTRRAF